jgi:hypothetical protein
MKTLIKRFWRCLLWGLFDWWAAMPTTCFLPYRVQFTSATASWDDAPGGPLSFGP